MTNYDETLQRYNAALEEYRGAIIDMQNKYNTTESYDEFQWRCSESERNKIEALRIECESTYREHYETL